MIRSIAFAILLLLALHFVALLGVVGWLAGTGRLDKQRVHQVVDTFKLTISQAQQQQQEAEQQAKQAQEKAEQAARLEAVADGPRTLQDHLAAEQRTDALAMHRVERIERETDDLRQQIERAKKLISKQKQELQQERDKFEQAVKKHNEQKASEDFQQTVKMYEQLKPDQAKQMFQDLIAQGETDRVVDYLAEMQLRKAAKVLQQFKSDQEIQQATLLLEKLRNRGVYPMNTSSANAAQKDNRT